MSKPSAPAYLYLARWAVKLTAALAIVVLVAAFQSTPAAAPAPEFAPLVSFRVLVTPTSLPAAMIVVIVAPTATPVPTLAPKATEPVPTEVPVPAEIVSLPADLSDALIPRKLGLRATTALAFEPSQPAPISASVLDSTSRAARVPILMYHYISDPPPGSDRLRRSLSVTPAHFDAQMDYLKQAGYQAITLYDLYDHLTQGKPLPGKPIILTIDDGYIDAFTFAAPILQKYGFVGTFFILTGPADRNGAGGYLNWAQIEAMSQAGMDIELHSREHVDLRNRPNDFLVHQIAGGKESLEAHTGRPVRWFAYPSGRYDAAVVRMLKSAGFLGAVTTLPGQTHTVLGLFDLQRVRISGPDRLETFKKAVTGNP
jgi:peptidoglycan/xylan/chitin deacetylase (PgdA/CDA1 family)